MLTVPELTLVVTMRFASGESVRGNINHVGAVLSGAKDPIDFLRGGIVAGDGLGGFSGEPDFAAGKIETVGAAQRS